MKAIRDYKIGDELWRHVVGAGTFRYVVDGVRVYGDEVQLEVECQSCTHGWKCRILVARDDYGKLHAVHMLNDNEDDSQRHWHGNYGMHFWPTKRQAREEGLRHLLREAKDRASKLRDQLKLADARVKELEAAIEGEASPTPPDPGHEREDGNG